MIECRCLFINEREEWMCAGCKRDGWMVKAERKRLITVAEVMMRVSRDEGDGDRFGEGGVKKKRKRRKGRKNNQKH